MNVYYPASAFVNFLTSVILGLFVLQRNFKSNLNRTYSYFASSVAFWSLCYFLWQISNTENQALFWSRALMAGAIFIPSTFFHLSVTVIGKQLEYKRKVVFWYCVSLILFCIDFTPLLVKGVSPKLTFLYWGDAGIFYAPFLAVFLGLTWYSHALMYRSFNQLSGVRRNQIKYLFLGTFSGFIGGATNYPLWYNIPVLPIGNILVSVYIATTAYAIIRYRLMDIRVAAARTLVFVFVYVPILAIPFITRYIFPQVSWAVPIALEAILAPLGTVHV